MNAPPKGKATADKAVASGIVLQNINAKSISVAENLGNCDDVAKQFNTLRAQFALHGHALHRSDPADGPVSLYAERWGLVRYLPDLDDAQRFLAQIGGGNEL